MPVPLVERLSAALYRRAGTSAPAPLPSRYDDLPAHLDALAHNFEMKEEKTLYYDFLSWLLRFIPFPYGKAVAVLGVGNGLESQQVNLILNERAMSGNIWMENVPIYSVDYNKDVLNKLRRWSTSLRILNHIIRGDITELSPAQIPPGSCALILMSSVLHEIRSLHGLKGVTRAIVKALERLCPGGFFLVREFRPPPPGNQEIYFNNQMARHFFDLFVQHFHQPEGYNWQASWQWKDKDTILADNVFAKELVLHFEMWFRDYYASQGENAFKNFEKWPELKERYVSGTMGLSGEDRERFIAQLMGDVGNPRVYAHTMWSVPDPDDDYAAQQYFTFIPVAGGPEIFPTERMIICFIRLPEAADKRPDREAVAQQLFGPIFAARERAYPARP